MTGPTDLERARLELAATRARAAAFASQLDEALLRVAALQAAVTRLSGRLDASRASEAQLQAEVATLRVHRNEAWMLRQSTSWRWTRPLRALSHPRRALRILLGRPV